MDFPIKNDLKCKSKVVAAFFAKRHVKYIKPKIFLSVLIICQILDSKNIKFKESLYRINLK